MTIFNRNEKGTDPVTVKPSETGAVAAPLSQPPAPSVATEPRRPQPVQPAAPVPSRGTGNVSVISRALKITGQLESTEDIQIDGEVDGDVRGVSVKVGSGAKVKGTVYGDEVEVSGGVEGKIEAKRVVLTSTARMSGDVVHQDIRIDSGAYIDGHCKPEFGKTKATVTPLSKAASAS